MVTKHYNVIVVWLKFYNFSKKMNLKKLYLKNIAKKYINKFKYVKNFCALNFVNLTFYYFQIQLIFTYNSFFLFLFLSICQCTSPVKRLIYCNCCIWLNICESFVNLHKLTDFWMFYYSMIFYLRKPSNQKTDEISKEKECFIDCSYWSSIVFSILFVAIVMVLVNSVKNNHRYNRLNVNLMQYCKFIRRFVLRLIDQ